MADLVRYDEVDVIGVERRQESDEETLYGYDDGEGGDDATLYGD